MLRRPNNGGTDEEILEWRFANGLRRNPTQILGWNSFPEKIEWRDSAAATVEKVKKLAGSTDIATIFDCIDATKDGGLRRTVDVRLINEIPVLPKLRYLRGSTY